MRASAFGYAISPPICGLPLFPSPQPALICRQRHQAGNGTFMAQQPPATEFGIAEARRVLGEVFAPWVMDLNLAIEQFDVAAPADAADWQPGAILRLPF